MQAPQDPSTPQPAEPANIPTFKVDWGLHALLKLVGEHEFHKVLDVGAGLSDAKRFMEFFGKRVVTVDMFHAADYQGDFLTMKFEETFDAIWCSHVLEHQRNPGIFLDKLFGLLKPGGVLAISVPIHARTALVAGHISSWSVPLLVYNLVLAGFDCRQARVLSSYELSLIVAKQPIEHPAWNDAGALNGDTSEIFAEVARYFPVPAQHGQSFAEQAAINWGDPQRYRLPRAKMRSAVTALAFNCKNLRDPKRRPIIEMA